MADDGNSTVNLWLWLMIVSILASSGHKTEEPNSTVRDTVVRDTEKLKPAYHR